MTRHNLPHTCLLDVSGELGPKAREQLRADVARFPQALVEYELIKGQMALLRSLPKVEMSEEMKKKIGGQIKAGIQRKLRERERAALSERRWKMASPALAGALALAACLLIVVSIQYVVTQHETERRVAVAKAEQSLRDYLDTDSSNMTDYAYHDMDDEIKAAEEQQRTISAEVSRSSMQKLIDDLDGTTDPDPRNQPGSL